MRYVIIHMKNYVFSDAVSQALQNDGQKDLLVTKVYTQEELEQYIGFASVFLLEVTRYPSYTVEERLKFRDRVKAANPDCKIVFVVDENSEPEVADRVRQAKKDGLIDQFIYGSISASYLVALVDTL